MSTATESGGKQQSGGKSRRSAQQGKRSAQESERVGANERQDQHGTRIDLPGVTAEFHRPQMPQGLSTAGALLQRTRIAAE